MQWITRPTALKIAAILSIIVALYAIPAYDIPGLLGRQLASSDPYWLIVGSFISDLLALAAAYGAWRGHRWGVGLLIGVMAYWMLQSVGGLVFAESTFNTTFAAAMLTHHTLVLALCFWPTRRAHQVA